MWLRRVAHAVLVTAAAPPYLIAYLLLVLCAGLVVVAEHVLPHARVGNCWSYVGPRWLKYGGYIAIRAARGVSLSGSLLVPHAIWIRELPPGTDMRQTVPLNRRKSRWFPWFVAYFPFKVVDTERNPVETNWNELGPKD